MRAVILKSLAIAAFAMLAWGVSRPMAVAEDLKDGAGAGKPPAARVNTLSPDEARRAARARDRAARLSKPAPAAKAEPQTASRPATATEAHESTQAPAATTRSAESRPKASVSRPAVRHARRSYRSRREYANGSGRTPRTPQVGDYVSPDVRLRPLPPGFAASDDDDAPSPRYTSRRAYAQPYPGAPPYPPLDYGYVEQ